MKVHYAANEYKRFHYIRIISHMIFKMLIIFPYFVHVVL